MPVESAADRASFLDVDEFAQGASYTLAAGGDPVTVNGIYDGPHAARDLGAGVEMSAVEPSFKVATADLPSGAGQGDTLVISEGTFTVKNPEPDGSGFTVLILTQST